MSTELMSHAPNVTLTRFWGGDTRGVCVCVQDWVEHDSSIRYICLSRDQAAALAEDLKDFSQGREKNERGHSCALHVTESTYDKEGEHCD